MNLFVICINTSLLILFHILIHVWTNELKKNNCDCSDIIHRKIINVVSLVFIAVLLINCMNLYNGNVFKINLLYLSIFQSILTIIYLSIIIDYIRKLKEIDCKCSEDWKKNYGYIFSLIYLTLSLLSLIIIIMFIMMGGYPIIQKIEENIKK